MPLRDIEYYDNNWIKWGSNTDLYRGTMHRMTKKLIGMLKELDVKTLLDIGCGNGEMLRICQRNGFICSGFDFSSVAIEMCKQQDASSHVWLGDANDKKNYVGEYDAYLALSFLEHVVEDLAVIGNLKPNRLLFLSLPSWNSPAGSHVRCFKSDSQIRDRYGEIVDIETIEKFESRRLVRSRTK